MKPVTLEQVVGDVRAAVKSLGGRGQVELTVVKQDGVLVHEVRRSELTQEDWERLMQERPRRGRR